MQRQAYRTPPAHMEVIRKKVGVLLEVCRGALLYSLVRLQSAYSTELQCLPVTPRMSHKQAELGRKNEELSKVKWALKLP